MSIRILPFRLISRDSREIPGVEGKTCIRLCCNQKWRKKLRVHFCPEMRTRKQWRKVSGLALGLSLTYRSRPDQHMSEMQLGRPGDRTFWGREK